jgi:hypothetical protein
VIEYIDNRLQEWATWSVMRLEGCYGIAGIQFAYDEPMPGVGRGYTMPSNVRCLMTEEAVAWLRQRYRGQGEAVIVHYRAHPAWSAAMQAEVLGVSVRTLWRRLEAAHEELVWYFLGREFGPAPQVEAMRHLTVLA